MTVSEWARAIGKHRNTIRARQALEVDAERLDWLEGEYEREQAWLRGEKPVGDMPPSLFRSNMPITRAAIDTARKAKPT